MKSESRNFLSDNDLGKSAVDNAVTSPPVTATSRYDVT
jgi:hypothetical protein